LIASLFLSGCVAQPEAAVPGNPPIFDRPRTATDELPAGFDGDLDAETSRFVGEDSAGDKYWVGLKNSTDECIVYIPANDNDYFVACSGPGMSATTSAGKVIEFASSPNRLSADDAELVGDTLLVQEPG
jgi:hypothetical protein